MVSPAVNGHRIAFFGGSFDPPHRGHLAVARAARSALELDTVLFAPVGAQPLKPQGSTAGFDDRVAMTRLAIDGEPGFALSLVDAPKRDGASNYTPNYTLETLLGLKKNLPAHGVLFCLMGADSFLALRRWYRASEIPFVASLIVASRPGQSLADLAAVLPPGLSLAEECMPAAAAECIELRTCTISNAAGATAPFHLLPGLHVDISATAIREEVHSEAVRIPAGEGHHSDLPDAVFDYIAAHNLYR
ncbi:MAG: nicotinate (nicotinamide) nucleotide adenylyltransferase [Terracidiphilus sp.]